MKTKVNDIPEHATGLHVFAIKETVDGPQAFIGWYLSNGDFHYSMVPYAPPHMDQDEESKK